MKRMLVLFPLLLTMTLTACPGNQVVVEAAIADEATQEARTLPDLEVRLLPYDRDALFDSLERANPEPEPAVPEDLRQQRQQIIQYEREWRVAEERWNEARDSLRVLSQEMDRMSAQGLRATPQYQAAFRNFERLDAEARQTQQRSQAAFARYDELQRTYLSRADSVRIVREAWEDQVYRDFPRIVQERLRNMRREEYTDTTDAAGAVRFRGVPRGQWWVMSRYRLPFEELYWNIPLQVDGDSVGVVLSPQNAQVREVF